VGELAGGATIKYSLCPAGRRLGHPMYMQHNREASQRVAKEKSLEKMLNKSENIFLPMREIGRINCSKCKGSPDRITEDRLDRIETD